MLMTRPLPAVNGVVEGNAGVRDEWDVFALGDSTYRFITLGLGDPVSGPKIVILHSEPNELPAPGSPTRRVWDATQAKRGTHWHRTDQWRCQMCEDQHFYIGNTPYDFGDYYLQHAVTPYFDPPGPTGMLMLSTDADRRGSLGVTRENKDLRGDAWVEAFPEVAFFPQLQRDTVHDDDAKAIKGNSISTGAEIPRRGLKGSVLDDSGWTELSDGSRICAILQGDPVSGPVILISHNAPGVVEPPAGTYGSDMMRVVFKGSCSVGGRTLGPQDFRVVEAGVPETEVVHGDEGSTQVLYVGDRRGWRSSGAGEADIRASEIAEVLDSASTGGAALLDT